MDASGTFTVPIDGVYMFTFTGSSHSDDVRTHVRIRADNVELGYFFFKDDKASHGNDEFSGSLQVVASLKKGQKVDFYLQEGYISSYSYFTGHLLFPI
jgi:hypothetical protein